VYTPRAIAHFVLLSALAAPVAAQDAAAPPRARTATLVGEIVLVDERRGVLTLRTSDGDVREHELLIDSATRITLQGRSLPAAALRAGQHVLVVVGETRQGRRRASAVKLRTLPQPLRPGSEPPPRVRQ
jgi:hypothetical protein